MKKEINLEYQTVLDRAIVEITSSFELEERNYSYSSDPVDIVVETGLETNYSPKTYQEIYITDIVCTFDGERNKEAEKYLSQHLEISVKSFNEENYNYWN